MKFHLYWLIAISTLLSAIVHSSSDTVAVGRNRLNNLQRKLKPWLKRRKPLPCWSCKLIVLELQNLFLSDSSERSVQKWLAFACEKFKVEDSAVCRGVASEFGVSEDLVFPSFSKLKSLSLKAEVFYIVAKVVMNPPALCTLFGSSCNYSFGHDNWTIPFPNTTKPPVETLPDIPVSVDKT